MSNSDYEIPNDDSVSSSDIHPESDLSATNLSEADLRNANLSKADLSNANLSGADVVGANLSEADLRGANLTDTILYEVNLNNATLSRGTIIDPPDQISWWKFIIIGNPLDEWGGGRFFKEYDIDISEPTTVYPAQRDSRFLVEAEDTAARMYHELRVAYSVNGLFAQAREARVRERRARRREAYFEGGWRGKAAYYSSMLSEIFTGYGVRLGPVVGWMILLFVSSTAVYLYAGIQHTTSETIAYSVLAFTAAPPPPLPSGGFVQTVVMIETFFGTLSTVLLGYVLGNREQV